MKRTLTLLLVAVMCFSTLMACAKDAGGAKTKDTLILGTGIDVGSFASTERTSSGDTLVQAAIYMNLFRVSYPDRVIKSEACVSWEAADDAKTFTFVIKDGIKFHNGAVLTADDVVYSIEQCKVTLSQMGWSGNLDTITALDEKTVQVKLLAPCADFLYIAEIPLLHQKTTEEAGENFRTNPVGCGPYMLVSHEAGYQVTLKAFDDYIMGKPYFENLIYRVIADPSAALMALEAGDIDAVISSAYSELNRIKANDKLSIVTGTFGLDALVINHRIEPFDDLNVRLAINYAINKQRCSEAMYEGLPSIATSHISVVSDERLVGYPYDLEKAKDYLALAGFPDGVGFPEVTIETIDAFSDYAQVIQSNLGDLGITAKVQVNEANSYISRMMAGEVALGVMSYGLGYQPSQYAVMLTTGAPFNFTGYGNAEVDRLLAEANQEIDDAKRHDLYVEACLIMERDAVYGLIGYQQILFVYNSDLLVEDMTETFLMPQFTRMK